MSRMTWVALAWTVFAIPVLAADPKPAKQADVTADVIKKLQSTPNIAEGEFRFSELSDYLAKTHSLPTVVNYRAFKANGNDEIDDSVLKFTKSNTLPLSVHITQALGHVQATYLIRKGFIEILPIQDAIRETKNQINEDNLSEMRAPLVSVILKEKPLNDALGELAEEFNLTIVLSPQAGDARTGFVTARLLNMPADRAIELLALQCDLRVIRKGTGYFVTTRDHASDLFGEKMDRDRAKAELENLRNQRLFGWGGFGLGPVPAPAPNPAPAPAPEPKP